jgi:hypothetical protein
VAEKEPGAPGTHFGLAEAIALATPSNLEFTAETA